MRKMIMPKFRDELRYLGWVIIVIMESDRDLPVLVCFVDDLLFLSKIEAAASKLGYKIVYLGRADLVASPGYAAKNRQLAEHLHGQGAELIEKISIWRPALIIFDLGNLSVPWREWLPLIKSAPATRRYPVICYASHVDTESIRLAVSSGADHVFARSNFSDHVLEIIQKQARIPDYQAIESACSEQLSPTAIHGLELFNQGLFFEAHEVLEEAWNTDQTLGRELYRAVLQIAVAYLQIERGNYDGAVKMFLRVRQWIEPLPVRCRGIEVAEMKVDAQRVYDALLALGRERISEFDRTLFRPVTYHIGKL